MTAFMLMTAIRSFLNNVVKDTSFETTEGTNKPPQVLDGWLPPKGEGDGPDYPFILVRPIEGEDICGVSASAQVKLLFGTYSNDANGFLDVINLMERVRIALLTAGIIDGSFRLDSYKWKLFEEQPAPEFVGEAVSFWTLPTIVQEVNLDD
ncbi:hypothetical protein [Tumebacillus flagellatus]|uniref:Uncharacterized protein n=1 Tax=Tumebacillus flagellatus TaxID=1157490 RepID=A0A074LUZ2_9BACL|nr:hypothetical protein [Tumebacillus flagellatus]KEO84759.1 hypothetical protein EL26_01750 [Tumebacillus flagellatus]